MNFNLGFLQSLSKEDKALKKALHNILGFKPKFMPYYVMALTHRSSQKDAKFNNERLEFLGDAFIGSIVGEYLFKKYPTQDEGYLTEMRSKIVSRQSLNSVALKMGLQKLVRYNQQDKILKRSHIFGNAFEALVGAIYLDKGYGATNQFIKHKLIGTYLDIDELETTEYNFKNKLYTWAQKNHYQMDFKLLSEKYEAGRKVFKVAILVNDQEFIEATGFSKKEASQSAAQKALELIETYAAPTFDAILPPEEFTQAENDINEEVSEEVIAAQTEEVANITEEVNTATLSTSNDEANEDVIDETKTEETTVTDATATSENDTETVDAPEDTSTTESTPEDSSEEEEKTQP